MVVLFRSDALLVGLLLAKTAAAFVQPSHSNACMQRGRFHHPWMVTSSSSDIDTTQEVPVGSSSNKSLEKAMFGMGCFWAPQDEFNKVMGVERVTTGYGSIPTATRQTTSTNDDTPASYISVCNGDGRVEAVLVEYDPSIVTYEQLLECFWRNHDASADPGKQQYSSVIWPMTQEQEQIAKVDVEKATEAYEEQGMNPPRTQVTNAITIETPYTPQQQEEDNSIIGATTNESDYFTQAEAVHQNFWTKLRLKVAILAIATLLGQSDLPFVNDVLADLTIKLVGTWVLLENAELVGRAADSFLKGKKSSSSS